MDSTLNQPGTSTATENPICLAHFVINLFTVKREKDGPYKWQPTQLRMEDEKFEALAANRKFRELLNRNGDNATGENVYYELPGCFVTCGKGVKKKNFLVKQFNIIDWNKQTIKLHWHETYDKFIIKKLKPRNWLIEENNRNEQVVVYEPTTHKLKPREYRKIQENGYSKDAVVGIKDGKKVMMYTIPNSFVSCGNLCFKVDRFEIPAAKKRTITIYWSPVPLYHP